MDATSSAATRRESTIALTSLLEACLVVEIGLFAWFGVVYQDEGWYLNAGRAVFEGSVPYRDFNYFQTPLLPYLYGLPQWLFGSSLLLGRATSVLFLGCAIVALTRSARLMAGDGAVRWTLALLVANPVLLYYCSLARSESATLMFSSLALWCFVRYRSGLPALVLAPGSLVLAAGVREPMVPAAAAATAYIWWRTPATGRQRLAAGALLLGTLAAMGVPAMLGADHVIFNLWSSQMSRGSQWYSVTWSIQLRIGVVYQVLVDFALLLAPLVVVVAAAATSYARGWRPRWRHPEDDVTSHILMVSAFAMLMFLPFVLAVPFETRYLVPTSGLLAVALSCAISSPDSRAIGVVSGSFLACVTVVVAVIVAPYYVVHAQSFTVPRGPEAQLRGAPDVIRTNMGPEDELLTLDPLLTLASGVRGTPGLEMGQFSYWARMDTASATRHGVFNRELLLREITAGQPKVVALTDFALTYYIGMTAQNKTAATPFLPQPFIVLPELSLHYRMERTIDDYGQFREPLYILVRKP